MHHAFTVGIGETTSGLQDAIDGFGDGQRPTLFDEGRQVAALDVFHDEIPDTPLHTRIVSVDDVGMAELGGGLHFSLKAFDGRLVFGHRRR